MKRWPLYTLKDFPTKKGTIVVDLDQLFNFSFLIFKKDL
jgi:hypothetical protein